MKQKTILVTGGAGFIGSNFAHHIYHTYPEYKIIVLDALTYAGNVENLPVKENNDRFEFWYGNIKNADLVEALISRSDIIVHFAAETHVSRSIFDGREFFETDVMGTHTLINAALKHQNTIDRFIHISTSEVYGTAETESMDEDHPLNPMTPYAAAKAGADRLVYSYWKTFGLPVTIVRPFNNYGPRQHLEKAIPRFITSCLLGEKITLHGNGSAARDYIHVEDTCRAISEIIHADIEKVQGEVFNVATDRHISMIDIAKTIIDNVPNTPGVRSYSFSFINDRPGQVERHTGNIEKIKKILGWEPVIDFETGIQGVIGWYVTNRPWWEPQTWMRSVEIMAKDGEKERY